ncbi:glycoside hydrolase family 16 protein [Yeosuana marina]|uniref:glycoside hydrolase family 16 protein n=1 Tax=Yeosuana marina TaxID=1565536 RepID=UPI0030EB54E3|tara:strand:+ start:189 stop:1004 length:816 start_codon:yes stop_codon:yes gene_type:complete
MSKLFYYKKLICFVFSLGLLFSCKDKTAEPPKTYQLVWSDEFDDNGVNLDNWNFVLWDAGKVNNEWQKYVNDTAYYKVEDGKLYITAKKTGENIKGGYTSIRLSTQDKKEFQYGRIEFRAKMPKGRGTWPALWMLGSNHDEVRWPKCGEIDVMEHVGSEPNITTTNIHTKSDYGYTNNKTAINLKSAEKEFHNYGIIWTKDDIKFYVDSPDNIKNTYCPEEKNLDNWPFDQPFYLIMNFAVGGTLGGKEGVDETIFPQSMVVDYVRVYQLK